MGVSDSDGPVVSKALIELPYVLIATRGQKRVQAHLSRRPVFLVEPGLCVDQRGGGLGVSKGV